MIWHDLPALIGIITVRRTIRQETLLSSWGNAQRDGNIERATHANQSGLTAAIPSGS
jgi:hypothetical protein